MTFREAYNSGKPFFREAYVGSNEEVQGFLYIPTPEGLVAVKVGDESSDVPETAIVDLRSYNPLVVDEDDNIMFIEDEVALTELCNCDIVLLLSVGCKCGGK